MTGVDLTAARGDLLRALIREACVGEPLAAAEVDALAARVRDPASRRLHARIAVDEERHAELGWRALAWTPGGEGAASVDHAERCFEEAMASEQRCCPLGRTTVGGTTGHWLSVIVVDYLPVALLNKLRSGRCLSDVGREGGARMV
ncbi:MAG: hypothetical protein ABJE95_14600 [Byssovorax sp.]